VLRWTDTLRPRWVACEQVPPCLPIWQEYAEVMRGWGYRTWTGVLNAADYGVPQTRKRAFLLASLDRQPERPEPTHAKGGDVDLFAERQPWVSMAEALGWGYDHKPSATLLSGGASTGGAEPYGPREREALRQVALRNGNQENACERPADEPAGTLYFGGRMNDVRWVVRTGNNSMATGRAGSRAGDGDVQAYERSCDEPAPTLDTGVGNKWTVEQREVWGDRPATTVVGSFRPDVIAAPGYRTTEDGPRQNAAGSVRVTVQEAAILQSFPRDYPWQGSKTKQFQQVGNAVPPRLAMHVLAAVLDVALPCAEVAA
jgi:DNA (cytosine-5)-methyltransferase 1